ncbi:MAG: hypothetical protein CL942_00575 [Desulfovibrio sp.]|nr:hypothetical protein [Desulfovibrio sp.]|tara:strand:+ start:10000 stop:10206 length:207 start_codon:yes stop_codon:yes gene_type:complete
MIAKGKLCCDAGNGSYWCGEKFFDKRLDAVARLFMDPGTGIRLGASTGSVVDFFAWLWLQWSHWERRL